MSTIPSLVPIESLAQFGREALVEACLSDSLAASLQPWLLGWLEALPCEACAVAVEGLNGGMEWLAAVGDAALGLPVHLALAGTVTAACRTEDGVVLLPVQHGGKRLGAVLLLQRDAGGSEQLPRQVAPLLAVLAEWLRLHEHAARKQADLAAVLDRESRYRALIEVCSDLVQSVGPDGRFLFVNQTWKRVLGYSDEDLQELNVFAVIHPDSLAHCQVAFQQLFEGKPLLGAEVDFVAKDGRKVTLLGNVVPRIVGGAVVATKGFFQDITEQRAAEAALAQGLAFLDQFVNCAPEAIVFLGNDGRVQRINPEFARLFGYAVEEAVGHHIDELVVPVRLQAEAADLCQRAGSDEVINIETVRRRKDGSEVHVSLLATPVRVHGQQVAVLCIYRDISDRRRLEAQLARSQRMEAVGRLAGGVAHDFNNLLTIINGTADLLLGDLPQGDPLRADLMEITVAGSKAAALTRQLLTFSRKQLLQPVVVDLNEVVLDVIKMLRRVIGEDVQLVTTTQEDVALVKADPGQLEQVVMNLAINARDAMPGGGVLTLETSHVTVDEAKAAALVVAPGEYVKLTVADTGSGMDAAVLDRLFEPFFSTKLTDGRGSGLGLSTVYGIVQQSGGAIAVESQVGSGSTFRVYLPRSDEPVQRERALRTIAGPGGTETVLVVEDDMPIRLLVERVLVGAGYSVLLAANGCEALELLEEHGEQIDLVFTDVVMPDMNGPQLVKRLAESWPKVAVLFTSGFTDDEVFRRGLGEQDANFIPKPYSAMALKQKVRALFDAR